MQYVELHCKSNFSFLEGASHPDELVQRAAALGYAGLALTDRESLAGVVRGYTAAKDLGFPYLIGAEVHPVDAPAMVLWPTDRAAYGDLCRLLSRGRLRCEKGKSKLWWADIAELGSGLVAGLLPGTEQLAASQLSADRANKNRQNGNRPNQHTFALSTFRDVFANQGYLLCELHRGVDDAEQLRRLRQLSADSEVPLVAAGGIYYHCGERMLMHDCVTAIRHGTTIDRVHRERFANSQRHLRSLAEIAQLYREVPDAIRRTVEIAERCTFQLGELKYEYPEEIAPPGRTAMEHLKRLTWEGALQRWPGGVPEKIIETLRHELQLIEEMSYEAYFLTVWDIVRFAREQQILCQGRGSAANSVVCYCLGVTNVDPSQTDLLFERFVSRERDEAPDIDVDFEHQRREEVLQYLYRKYGRNRAGMTATVITYRAKSAIREVGKALGISSDVIEALAKLTGSYDRHPELPERCRESGLDPDSQLGHRFLELTQTLMGFPRHLSQHVGGMVMTAGSLCELCPIENAAMDGRTVIQWDKDDLDEIGILKVDVLALGMLSALHRCFDLVQRHHGRPLSLASIPVDDTATYDMICDADTMGVFQIESRAQMGMLPRLRPRCFYDLVIEVAIVRPGPIQGDMVHPFLQARENPAAAVYPNEAIRGVLQKTLGVPIFQEQAMRLAVVAAGFTPGEADQLRRAMAAWRRPGVIDQFRLKLLEGMRANGLTGEFAEHVFRQIRGFGEYGFPESHAASFALLVYASCYLKRHYPAAFCVALLNSQPMGFYAPAQLIADARQHGVRVHGVDVNHSQWDSTLQEDANRDQPAIRLGLRTIRGFPVAAAERIVSERTAAGRENCGRSADGRTTADRSESDVHSRNDRLYRNVGELTRRTGLSQSVITMLADADALGSLVGDRRAAVWQSLAQEQSPGQRPLLDGDDDEPLPAELTPMSPLEEVHADYHTTGLSLKAHPISFARRELNQQRCVCADQLSDLRDGRHVRVAGLVLLRQRPSTAKGITFVTMEDETGAMNLVLFAAVWKRFYRVATTSNTWMVDGKLENRKGVIHVIVGRLTDLADAVHGLSVSSRDFR